jgi:cell division protein ZapA (FtsZ GTPase activity inhibitor)
MEDDLKKMENNLKKMEDDLKNKIKMEDEPINQNQSYWL